MKRKPYLNELRIGKAKSLILIPELNINEIAGMLGYPDSRYFIRDFTELTGQTPAAFREQSAISKPFSDDFLLLCENEEARRLGSLRQAVQKLGLGPVADFYRIAVTIGRKGTAWETMSAWTNVRLGLGKTAYLVPEQQVCTLRQSGRALLDNDNTHGVGISRPIRTIEEMENALEEADIAAHHFFMTGKSGLYEYTWEQHGDPKRLRELESALLLNAVTPEELALQFKNGRFHFNDALHFYNRIMTKSCEQEEWIGSAGQLVDQFIDVDRMLSCLFRHTVNSAVSAQAGRTRRPQSKHEMFNDILDFVHRNYLQEITLQSLSLKFNINLSYTSQLFKKETGLPFTKYLTDLRMSHSCRLLMDTRLSIQEISERTGFTNYFYFTKVFKKTNGVTPTTFRQLSHKAQ
jgi:two-component system response regulator YesN